MPDIDSNSGSHDKDNRNEYIDPIDQEPEFYKVWMVESNNSFRKESSTETVNYHEAFEIFNQKSKSGKSVILYEIQKSKKDNSIFKKIPFLNSAVIEERIKQKETSQRNLYSSDDYLNKNNNEKLSIWKYGIIILVGITAALLITMFLLDIISGNGNMVEIGNMTRHFILYEFAQSNIEFLV